MLERSIQILLPVPNNCPFGLVNLEILAYKERKSWIDNFCKYDAIMTLQRTSTGNILADRKKDFKISMCDKFPLGLKITARNKKWSEENSCHGNSIEL